MPAVLSTPGCSSPETPSAPALASSKLRTVLTQGSAQPHLGRLMSNSPSSTSESKTERQSGSAVITASTVGIGKRQGALKSLEGPGT